MLLVSLLFKKDSSNKYQRQGIVYYAGKVRLDLFTKNRTVLTANLPEENFKEKDYADSNWLDFLAPPFWSSKKWKEEKQPQGEITITPTSKRKRDKNVKQKGGSNINKRTAK